MFTIDKLLQPDTIGEVSEILKESPDAVVLGGCGFLRMGVRRISTAVDLSRCGLDNITESDDYFHIGAMSTLHDIEKNPSLNRLFNGIIAKAVGNILGTQFRRCATVGASVYSKYGFSDLIPSLLVLDTEVELINNGRLPLRDFLDRPVTRDVLTRIHIKKDGRRASYQNLRNASADFPILNASASKHGDEWLLVVGARPGRAQIAVEASRRMSDTLPEALKVEDIVEAAIQEFTFGSNNKATAEYRRAVCPALLNRAIGEVLA